MLAMLRLVTIDPGVVGDGGNEKNHYDVGDEGEEADADTRHTVLTMPWT